MVKYIIKYKTFYFLLYKKKLKMDLYICKNWCANKIRVLSLKICTHIFLIEYISDSHYQNDSMHVCVCMSLVYLLQFKY